MELSINDLRELIGHNQKNVERTATRRTQIAVLDRGWVFVGRVTDNGDRILIEDAACVRVRGTTDGLGQLARSGPLKDTKLDKAGTVTVPASSVIALIDCEEKAWESL